MVEQIKKHPEDWYNEGLKMIKRSGNNLLRLVNQMLDLSKLEAGVLPVHLVQGDIITYLKYVLDSFYSLAAGKNIELHFQSVRKEWLMDYDQEKLREILSNLLSNAIKFTPEGGRVELAVSSWRSAVGNSKLLTGNCLLLTVTDNGIGISKDDLPFIFDRFYSPHPNALSYGESRREAGAGIGLALVKELVKLLGGEISAKSKAGKGSEFRIILPVTNKAPLEQTLPIKPDPESEPAITLVPVDEKEEVAEEITPQLLIIEDNRDVVRYLFSILENDYQVEMAENGEEGMEKALENIPDIIISDVMMPKMDGFELCDKLKKDFRTSHIPIILLTAKADYSSKIEGLERGADAYLAKPFNKEELLVRLQKLLELRKRLQAYYTNFTPLPPSSDKGIQIEDAFLQKLRETVEKNISKEDFGIFEACRSLRISRTQLHRKLKAVTGKSTSHYIRSLRLHKARELLQNSKLNVSEVAFEVGFNSLSYFSRSFKEEFGVNPNEMRN